MANHSNTVNDKDDQALQDLIINNPDFEKLERLVDQFNIFEALGAVNVELRHSEFLAYLLNPNKNHGLGDSFVKHFLQSALKKTISQEIPIRPIEIDLWDFNDLEVFREWQNIDILLISKENQLAVIIENKIESTEHDSQLQRYWDTIGRERSGYKIIGIFLTPEGRLPLDDQRYLPLSYTDICIELEKYVIEHKLSISESVIIAITHYTQMLRRHIVNESEIADLCRRIYRKHQQALDLIYEYKPDNQGLIKEYLDKLITDGPMILERSRKSEIDFIPKQWSDAVQLNKGDEWIESKRILVFYFRNYAASLHIVLTIGPGPQEIRQKLLDLAMNNQPPFKSAYRQLNQKWNNVYSRTILTKKDYENPDYDAVTNIINTEWDKFMKGDYKEILEIVRNQEWIWK